MRMTRHHHWIREQGERLVLVGITRHFATLLGDVVFIALPRIGASLEADEVASVVESTKAAIDLVSPLKGTVVAVNEALLQDPSLLEKDPEGDGWLFSMHYASSDSFPELFDRDAYLALFCASAGGEV